VINAINRCQNQGVLVLEAGRNILRLLPPLVITREQIDRVADVLDKALGKEESEHFPKN
jgi:4-aminobutyrate aminotransferase-like enzyme